MEHHIERHDFSVHGNKECHVCRNILENESESDDELPLTSATPPSSVYTSRSSSSLSSEPPCQKCNARLNEEEEKLADIEYLVDVTKTKSRRRARAGISGGAGGRLDVGVCEHRLQRKHGGCRVCYECSRCKAGWLTTLSIIFSQYYLHIESCHV